jgi:hypothetical protein
MRMHTLKVILPAEVDMDSVIGALAHGLKDFTFPARYDPKKLLKFKIQGIEGSQVPSIILQPDDEKVNHEPVPRLI